MFLQVLLTMTFSTVSCMNAKVVTKITEVRGGVSLPQVLKHNVSDVERNTMQFCNFVVCLKQLLYSMLSDTPVAIEIQSFL